MWTIFQKWQTKNHRIRKVEAHKKRQYPIADIFLLSNGLATRYYSKTVILPLCYQKANIQVTGYENALLPDNYFDCVIGNVPFGNFQVNDPQYNRLHFPIHDYFFAKSIDKLRTGGIMAFITSSGTLDKKDDRARKYIAERCDLIGAVRLPNNAFKGSGTKIMTDVIFLQKRDTLRQQDEPWLHLAEDANGITMNRYFVEHPEMICGRMEIVAGPYGPTSTCQPIDPDAVDRFGKPLLETQIDTAMQHLTGKLTKAEISVQEESGEDTKYIDADPFVRNFSYTVKDNKIYYREGAVMRECNPNAASAERIRKLVELRDTTRALIDAQLQDLSDEEIHRLQGQLNRQYDAFRAKHGLINSRSAELSFRDDSSYYLLCSLENVDEKGNFISKSDMFTKRTIRSAQIPDHADTASDALALSIGERAKVDMYWGSNGSKQTISVPANSNNAYLMKNDEWSLQVNIKKTDSETGNQIAADAQYEIFQWDTVTGKYHPTGGYNTYSVQRQGDGTYAVINSAAYATTDSMRHTLYYTQRNTGKFIIVESKAPTGYFGDWTDINHPGIANTPLGKRGYYIEITEDSDNSVIWLDNADYNADIATTDKGGTKLVTRTGVETTVTIYDTAKDPSRTYNTDNSGKAANEDSYTITPTDGVMKNDRTLGEISISKVDLDAVRYVGGSTTHGTALASGQAHGDASLDGAVYDLYAAEDITHPDGVTGVVDYSKIVDADGNPIWHTTIRDNSGQWVSDYLPVLKKDHLVASAKIENGWLCFSNLYLGKYYVVERSTGVVIPLRDGALAVSGTYPTVDSRTKAATGQTAALAKNGSGQYTDWVYKNQFSTVSKGKALDGSWTYDAYYLSFAGGYLCDEHNYYITPAYSDEGWYVEKTTFADNRQAAGEQIDKTSYSANYHIHADNALAESQDQVAKGNVEISKIVSSSGQSNGLELEGAGFTFFLVSDLSKAEQFEQTRSGSYTLQSILDAYIDKTYDNEHPKWDFSAETQAIAKTYEVNADEIAAYNKTLTAVGENKNGKGDGWQPTGSANEYQLAEIFSNDTGNIRVQGLPYGTYLVVETTVPHDLFQAEPFIVTVDPEQDNNPWGAMATPKGSVMTGSDSYQKFTVLDEEIEVYLRITKIDEETGKPVLLPDTTFQIYWLDEQGHYRYDSNGNPKLVTMTDTVNSHLTKDVTTFYTNGEGILTLPEKLPLGKYRIVEVTGPNGFYNEWLDSAGYENGVLADDADGSYYVDFEITTDRIYAATGNKNENGMGYTVKYGPRVEHIAVRHKDAQRNIRIDRLDPRFSETALREYYRQLHRMPTEMQQEYRQENAPAKPKWQPTELQPTVRRARYLGKLPRRYPKVSGFMACYYHYCALLRKAYHGKSTKRCYFLLREDFLLFSRYQQQTKFLWETHIETMDELLAYKENAEVQIQQLARQRKGLYRQKREPERAAREEKIKSLTQQMKALRHEVYICSDIETDAAEVQEKLRQAELATQEERNEVKQDEQRRRSSRSDGAGSDWLCWQHRRQHRFPPTF